MDSNRYQPPRARLDPSERDPGSIPKAIAIGTAIDLGGTILASNIIAFFYGVALSVQGHSTEQITQAFAQIDRWSGIGLLMMIIGLAISVYAGYVCAAIANRRNFLAPGILSTIIVASAVVLNANLPAAERTESQAMLVLSAVNVIAVLIGAFVHNRKLTEPASHPAAKS